MAAKRATQAIIHATETKYDCPDSHHADKEQEAHRLARKPSSMSVVPAIT